MNAITQIFNKAKLYLLSGNKRSQKAKKHIVFSAGIKGVSILISFILVPLTIGYVNENQYGIWITLFSIVSWFNFFDVGLGKGLRNRLAESMAKGDREAAKTYVSSTYFVLVLVSSGLLLLFCTTIPFLDWGKILNAPDMGSSLMWVVLVTFIFFALSFTLKLITTILFADQRPAAGGLLKLFANAISLLIIFLLTQFTEGSLLYLSIALGAAPFLVFLLATFYFFKYDYKEFSPSFSYVNKDYFKDLMSLGLQFFVIRITGIIIFSTDNMIITQIYSPAEVTPYNIAFRYFNLLTLGFTIVTTPFWAAYTDSYTRGDMDWIKRTNKRLIQIWGLMTIGGVFMLIISKWFYSMWVPTVEVPFLLTALMFVFSVTKSWGSIFVVLINGVGKVRLQLITSVIGALANIPLSIYFAKNLGMGTPGIILASTICLFYGPIIAPIQYKKIMNKSTRGIWDK